MVVLLCMLYLVQKKEPYYQGEAVIGYPGGTLIESVSDYGPDNVYGWYKTGYQDGMYGSHCNALKLPNCVEQDATNPARCTKCIFHNPYIPWNDGSQLFIPNYGHDPDLNKRGLGGCKLNPIALTMKYTPPDNAYTCPSGVTYDVGPISGRILNDGEYYRFYRYVRCTMKVGDLIDKIKNGVIENGIDYSKIEALPSGNRDDIISGYWTNIHRWDTDPTTFNVAMLYPNLPTHVSKLIGISGGNGAPKPGNSIISRKIF